MRTGGGGDRGEEEICPLARLIASVRKVRFRCETEIASIPLAALRSSPLLRTPLLEILANFVSSQVVAVCLSVRTTANVLGVRLLLLKLFSP